MLVLGNPHQAQNFKGGFLCVPQQESIHKRRQGLRIESTGAASQNQRQSLRTVFGSNGQPAQIQQVQDVRVVQLVLQREADDVKLAQGPLRLERVQRDSALPHQSFHV